MNLGAAILAFTEFSKALTALANLALQLKPYLTEWMDKTDETELQSLLAENTPAAAIRAGLLSGRIKARRLAESQRPV